MCVQESQKFRNNDAGILDMSKRNCPVLPLSEKVKVLELRK